MKYTEYTVTYEDSEGNCKEYKVLSCNFKMLESYLRCEVKKRSTPEINEEV